MHTINAHVKIGQKFSAERIEKELRFYTVDKFLSFSGVDPITNKSMFTLVLSYKNATHFYDTKYNLCFDKNLITLINEN